MKAPELDAIRSALTTAESKGFNTYSRNVFKDLRVLLDHIDALLERVPVIALRVHQIATCFFLGFAAGLAFAAWIVAVARHRA